MMPIPYVQPLLQTLDMGRSRFLYGLDRTPDDRLNWSPTGEATTPLQLAGKTAGMLGLLAHLITNRSMPERRGELLPPPQTREAAKAAVEAAFNQLTAAISGLTEADLEQQVPMPWGQMVPVAFVLWWLNHPVGYQQGQLNYIQTAYGDKDSNIPPNWGRDAA